MCIRDSQFIATDDNGNEQQAKYLPIEGIDNLYIFGSIDACLLYTSDAADDLLCVDLGGRRIIKKKKKQT